MFIHLNNILIGKSVHMSMSRCIVEMAVNVNNNTDFTGTIEQLGTK